MKFGCYVSENCDVIETQADLHKAVEGYFQKEMDERRAKREAFDSEFLAGLDALTRIIYDTGKNEQGRTD
jgi:hypothetical protein